MKVHVCKASLCSQKSYILFAGKERRKNFWLMLPRGQTCRKTLCKLCWLATKIHLHNRGGVFPIGRVTDLRVLPSVSRLVVEVKLSCSYRSTFSQFPENFYHWILPQFFRWSHFTIFRCRASKIDHSIHSVSSSDTPISFMIFSN